MDVRWLVIFAALTLLAQALIFRYFGLRGLNYRRYFSAQTATAGEDIELVEQVENRKWLPMPWILLESMFHVNMRFSGNDDIDVSQGEFFQNHRSVFSMKPYTRIIRRHRVTCLKRGCYELSSATMTCGDLVGMRTMNKRWSFNQELLVYPRTFSLADLAIPSHSWQGNVVVRRWLIQDPFLTSGVREYRYGDPLNQINWKATARSGRLQIHNRDCTADFHLMILLNFEIAEDMWDAITEPERVEHGITLAASIAEHAISLGIETGFACNGQLIHESGMIYVPPQSGYPHLNHLMEVFARLEMVCSGGFYTLLDHDIEQGRTNTDYVILTAYTDDRLAGRFTGLRALGNAVEVIDLAQPTRSEGWSTHVS